jgi:hypothetical protein
LDAPGFPVTVLEVGLDAEAVRARLERVELEVARPGTVMRGVDMAGDHFCYF